MAKTTVQQLMSELEKLHPELFNIYTPKGREFVNHFHKYLEIEKQQHEKTWYDSTLQFDNAAQMTNKKLFEDYYTETYRGNNG